MHIASAIFIAALFFSDAKGDQLHYRVLGEVTEVSITAGTVPAHMVVGASFVMDLVFDPDMASGDQRPDPVSGQFLFSDSAHFSISGAIAGTPLILGGPVTQRGIFQITNPVDDAWAPSERGGDASATFATFTGFQLQNTTGTLLPDVNALFSDIEFTDINPLRSSMIFDYLFQPAQFGSGTDYTIRGSITSVTRTVVSPPMIQQVPIEPWAILLFGALLAVFAEPSLHPGINIKDSAVRTP